jgi:hypothetical protein
MAGVHGEGKLRERRERERQTERPFKNFETTKVSLKGQLGT